MRGILSYFKAEIVRLRREEEGVVMAVSLAVFLFLFVLGLGVYTLGTTIYEREVLQNASDAAAYSAATVQADALSRMAMLNKALSYTYIQMSRKQMDCITAKWLQLVYQRYFQDRKWSRDWAGVLFIPKGAWPIVDLITAVKSAAQMIAANILGASRVKAKDCAILGSMDDNGTAWFCGYHGVPDQININGGSLAWSTLRDFIHAYDTPEDKSGFLSYIKGLESAITHDKALIEMLNQQFPIIHNAMCNSIEKTILIVLQRNIVERFGQDALKDFYFSFKAPTIGWNPYYIFSDPDVATKPEEMSERAGYFKWMQNTEDDERKFLAMAGSETYGWALPDFFISSSLRDQRMKESSGGILSTILGGVDLGKKSAGVDQWFVRGRHDSTTENYTREDGGVGLRRVFWDTNTPVRNQGLLTSVTRGNHMIGGRVHVGNPLVQVLVDAIVDPLLKLLEVAPSVFTFKGGTDKNEMLSACTKINASVALYAEYEWASGKWFCWNVKHKKWRLRYRCKGNHFAFPKYYCGVSHINKDGIVFSSANEIYDDDDDDAIEDEEDKKEAEAKKVAEGGEQTASDEVETYEPPPRPDVKDPVFTDDDINEFAKQEQGQRDSEPNRILSSFGDVVNAPIDVSLGAFRKEAKTIMGKHFLDMLGAVNIGKSKTYDHHGYADCTEAISDNLVVEAGKGLAKQSKLNTRDAISRKDYRSCAIGIYWGSPLFLRGYARIYGDDNQICSRSVYEGACAQPWLLNERFFGPDGTITVAVAKRRRNVWAQLADKVTLAAENLYAIGNPQGKEEDSSDLGTYMWTMSSARAAYRDAYGVQSSYRYLNPLKGNDCLGNLEPGESGCVCDTAKQYLWDAQNGVSRQWNLCVTDWLPTLLPVAMADRYRAIDGSFVENPSEITSAFIKLFHLDFGQNVSQLAEGDKLGWMSLDKDTTEQLSDTFLRIKAPGSDSREFAPSSGRDWRDIRRSKIL